ncbi:MAG: hypothetical protein KDD22_02585 [Bdellovibrionales bacterium]|nr:hypothetical protein [Bdellovibrionales bacterium]
MKRSFSGLGAAIFLGTFVTSFFLGSLRWGSVIYVAVSDAREPAAVRKSLDVSGFKGRDLLAATHRRLLSTAKIVDSNRSIGLELGNFVTNGIDGKKVLACQAYQKIKLKFRAEGIAESGKIPEMTVEGLCEEAKDLSRLKPLWIPLDEIMMQSPGEIEIQSLNDHPVKVSFKYVGSTWPTQWLLQSVRMSSLGKSRDDIYISPTQVRKMAEKPLTLHWGWRKDLRPENFQEL